MAASVARTGNVWFVQATETGALSNTVGVRLAHIIVVPTGASANIILKDTVTGVKFFHGKVASADDTEHFPFEQVPIFCPNGITVDTISNCDIILVLHPGGQS
jgi:hypothetical protein